MMPTLPPLFEYVTFVAELGVALAFSLQPEIACAILFFV